MACKGGSCSMKNSGGVKKPSKGFGSKIKSGLKTIASGAIPAALTYFGGGTPLAVGMAGAGGVAANTIANSSGSIANKIKGGFKDTPATTEYIENLRPNQLGALNSVIQQGQQGLNDPYAGWGDIQQGAMNNFSQDIVPGLLEGFASSGDNNYSSPVLQTNLSSAGAGLAERLAAMKSQYGMQNRQNSINTLLGSLGHNQEIIRNAPQQGWGSQLMGSIPALASLYGQYSNNQNQSNLMRQLQMQR